MSEYQFQCDLRGEDLDLFYEDGNIAIDITPNKDHDRYKRMPRRFYPGYEVVMPVDEVENLITTLQTMVAKIRERHPDAA